MLPEDELKNRRGVWGVEDMAEAANAVIYHQMPLLKAAQKYMVPRTTLRRHVQKGGCVKKQLGRKMALTEQQEQELAGLILDMKSKFFKLTTADVRRLVYQFCFKKNIKNPFNNSDGMPGRDWVQSYMKRHRNVNLPTTVPRTHEDINKENSENFFQTLSKTIFEDQRKVIPDANVYNVQEFECSTDQKAPKIISRCSGKQIRTEDKENYKLLCCSSAIGNFVPPMLVFPKTRSLFEMTEQLIPGSITSSCSSGFLTEDDFVRWLNHFVDHVQPKHRIAPTLLILDGHNCCTKSLRILEIAEMNNIVVLSTPTSCAQDLQPLLRTFFKSLSRVYEREVRVWSHVNSDSQFEQNIAIKLLRNAYCKAATVENAVNSFEECGIVPFCFNYSNNFDNFEI